MNENTSPMNPISAILDNLHFRISINGKSVDLYTVEDYTNRVCKYVGYSSNERLHLDLEILALAGTIPYVDALQAYREYLETLDITPKERAKRGTFKGFCRFVSELVLDPSSQMAIPNPSMFDDSKGWRLFAPVALHDGDWSAWHEVLSRMDHPELLKAWVWSIFLDVPCRQALWIQGEGSDGKSVLCNALADHLGHLAHSISSATLKASFGLQDVVGKRLVVFADTKNANLVQTEALHQILGGDKITVAKRFVGQVEVDNAFRVIVTSNLLPELSGQTNDQTRVLVVRMLRGPDYSKAPESPIPFAERLKMQLPAFLGECKRSFAATGYNVDKGRFDLPEVGYDALTSMQQTVIDAFLDHAVEEDEDSHILPLDLHRDFNAYCAKYRLTSGRLVYSDLLRTIKRRYGVEFRANRKAGKVSKSLKGLRLNCVECEGFQGFAGASFKEVEA